MSRATLTPLGDLRTHGGRPALFEGDRTCSYAELADLVEAAAASRGAERELIFLEARNEIASIVEYLACLGREDPVFLFAADQTGLSDLITRYAPDRVIAWTPLDHAVPERAERPLAPSLAVLLSTSGTTGSPKLVKLSGDALGANAQAIAQYLGLGPDDRAMTSLKYNYSFGMSVINSHLAVGAALILTDESVTNPGFWEQARRHEATNFSGVPYSFEMLARQGDGWAGLDTLRHVAQAGGRLEPALVRHFAALGAERGWRFFVMYGQTEAAPRMAWLPPERAATHADHIGRPIPGGAFDLVDGEGRTVAGEGEGELIFRGPSVMMGYATGRGDLALETRLDRLATGDIARRDADGFYRIVGRVARFVKPFGLRINLDEVQADARAMLADAVATGDDVGLIIVTESGDAAARAALHAQLCDRYKLPPHSVTVIALDAIPRLSSGKIDYRRILEDARGAPAAGRRSVVDIFTSPAFYRRAWAEGLAILGMGKPGWNSVAEIFAMFVGGYVAGGQGSFRALGGDSLSYIQVALALEDHLGHLPEGWEGMALGDLEQARFR
ncbi:AMP-binding protein [Sphingomonas gei]|uniref:AMP-binding protein n=1 Tax=Sphingomonas gei TaxID=1395960 RepID=UPI001442733F|nr:AMP-binding protein [Sphingomonas gei]